MRKTILSFALCLMVVDPSLASEWLLGNWEAEKDGIKAGLIFKDDTNVDAIGKSGKVQPATYTISGNEITMHIDLKVIQIKNHFRISKDKKKLTLYSKEKAETVDYYKK